MTNSDLRDDELKKDIQDWVDSWWQKKEPPKTLEGGQVWTIFHPAELPDREGTMVCILSVHGDQVYVVPLHTRRDASTGIEPVLTESSPPFDVPIVAVVEGGLLISSQAFQRGRFLGTFSAESLNRITQSFEEFRTTVGALSRLQYLEASLGPDKVPYEEIAAAFESGILNLVSPEVSFEELVRLHRELEENLRPYHEQAMAILFAEEGLAEKLARLFGKIRAAGEYIFPETTDLQPAAAMVAMSKRAGKRPKKPAGLPNPLEIDIVIPEAGGKIQILPPEGKSESADKLKEALAVLRESKALYFYGMIPLVGDENKMGFPEFGEVPVSKTKRVILSIPADTKAILVGLGPDRDGLERAVSAASSFQPPEEPGVLWVFYHPGPES